ncbi:DUF4416 family protein [Thermotoga sp. SG1]|uniref:DUF4416 family protein n=1 Tax=Thermotoga sp. SG1 TaxID=126739 RepID=UPI000CAB7F1C|nr:DUF4416 family protein [Thermotoga sp. SG1]PLV57235.1 hypothetical protein AS006_02780 [Thermotoga sp. SG1]
MGEVKVPDLVNLVMFIFASHIDYWFNELKPVLEERFGPMDYVSDNLDFEKYTFYYSEEMGQGLKGKLVSFERLIHPHQLADIKLETNSIEKMFSIEGKRKVNIDPGYIHHTQFVLASTKHWGNRIYIGKGIYAEVTLAYVRGKFKDMEFTYPNYREEEYKKHLERIREIYLKKRRKILK